MSKAEQASPLDALAAQAEGLEVGQVEQGGPVAAEQPKPSNAEILAGAFAMFRDLACMILDLQTPKATFPDRDAGQLGQAWGAVCDKRGVDLARIMGDYGAEVTAVVITATVLKRVATAAKAELAARDPAAVTEAAPVPAAEPEGGVAHHVV